MRHARAAEPIIILRNYRSLLLAVKYRIWKYDHVELGSIRIVSQNFARMRRAAHEMQ